jgi:uncharacterized membrane protein
MKFKAATAAVQCIVSLIEVLYQGRACIAGPVYGIAIGSPAGSGILLSITSLCSSAAPSTA